MTKRLTFVSSSSCRLPQPARIKQTTTPGSAPISDPSLDRVCLMENIPHHLAGYVIVDQFLAIPVWGSCLAGNISLHRTSLVHKSGWLCGISVIIHAGTWSRRLCSGLCSDNVIDSIGIHNNVIEWREHCDFDVMLLVGCIWDVITCSC